VDFCDKIAVELTYEHLENQKNFPGASPPGPPGGEGEGREGWEGKGREGKGDGWVGKG
jgi:hypothetical protein